MSDFNNLPTTDAEWLTLLERLDTRELHNLNRLVCDRLDYLNANDISSRMADFRVGQRVTFTDKRGTNHIARVLKHNRKTIKVSTPDGRNWNVSPMLLEALEENDFADASGAAFQDNTPNKNTPTAKAPTTAFNTSDADATTGMSAFNRIPEADDWLGGYFRFPGLVDEDTGNGQYQPHALVWMDGDLIVRSVSVLDPEESKTPEAIQKSFMLAVNEPAEGDAGYPRSIRFADKEIINKLKHHHSGIEFIFTATPEIDEFIDGLTDALTPEESTETYAQLGLNESDVAEFFEATATLYKNEPWDAIPHELCLIGISNKALQLENAVVVILGQEKQHYGFLLFDSFEDYQRYMFIAQLKDITRAPEIPSHRAVTFEPLKTIDNALRKECMDNGWQLAEPNAYPDLFLPVAGGIARAPKLYDLHVITSVAKAIITLLDTPSLIEGYWYNGAPQSLNTAVETSEGSFDMRIALPALPKGKTLQTLNVVERMILLQQMGDEQAFQQHELLSETLADAYIASPEYQMQAEPGAGFHVIMEFSFNYLRIPVPELLPIDLEEILYEVIPRKVMVNATEADAIVEDAIGFFSFLERVYKLEPATECLKVLGPKAIQRLRHALSDTTKFGMGKSMLTGNEIERITFDELDLPIATPPTALTPKQKKQRKNKRKNARKARKKSRS